MKNCLLLIALLLFSGLSFGQQYVQTGMVHTEIQAATQNGVPINGSSKDMKIEYPPSQDLMVLYLDPMTLQTDNIEFNEQLQNSFLGNIEIVLEVDVNQFEYHSHADENITVSGEATINNNTSEIIVVLTVSNKKTNNQNMYQISGSGAFNILDYGLEEIFPNLDPIVKFQFSQSLQANFR
ncbi:hypothetical protein KFE98_07000 [bacterium SCSIO 12741]|nr:hypothetical protein KFE98_07000 [bacterium SCSIO 12741]